MYKATRDFMNERQKYCPSKLNIVKMKFLPLGVSQNCFENAHAARSIDANNSGSKSNLLRSGWMIFPYNKEAGHTEIVQHWWNYDPVLGQHFDTTPLADGIKPTWPEFVEDNDFAEFGTSIIDEIESNVGKDIAYMNGEWFHIKPQADGQFDTVLLKNLDHRSLLLLK